MARHKFKIGQLVRFRPFRSGVSASPSDYKILRLLPSEGDQPQYRVKCTSEPFERIAREGELSSR